MRDQLYDILFEPIEIGPVTAKNRFFQVPHCNGGGYRAPSAVAEMRRVKSEGGWGVIFTEQVEIHHSSEIAPFELRLWDDDDLPALAKMSDAMHEFGALAGIELVYPGINGPNLYSKEIPLAATAMPIRTSSNDPVHARSMDREDLRNLRRWHRNAFLRAKRAGYDLVCLYGAHGHGIIQQFLSSVTNQRTDQYGGSLENRSRLLRELVAEAKDAIGDTCGVSLRLALEELGQGRGFSNAELRDLIEMHGELPDVWDLAHGTWEDCSSTSRFQTDSAQEKLVVGIKALTSKPVVGVGRFTSPDTMVRMIRSGTLDFIGCARPSIADPFLPQKIAEGRIDEIRECIGCNMCVAGDMTMSISRCTQNPTFMEEWRKGWHPERIPPKGKSESVLIVGGGPAGLEAARSLGLRGYRVALAEAGTELGGRVARESRLPGLSEWRRVRDYRVHALRGMPNVDVYLNSSLTSGDILGFGFEHVAIATGATWRSDGVGRAHVTPLPSDPGMPVFSPDDLMDGTVVAGRVVLFDDDHYYMGGVLAELLSRAGAKVTLITPAAFVSEWTRNTLEQAAIHRRLANLGVEIVLNRAVVGIEVSGVRTECAYTGSPAMIDADAVVLVTALRSNDTIFAELMAKKDLWTSGGIESCRVIGDAAAPGPIAWATYAGHSYARSLDCAKTGDALPFRRELPALAANGHGVSRRLSLASALRPASIS